MNSVGSGQPRIFSVKLKYLKWDDKYEIEKPFQLYADIPPDSPQTVRGNVRFEEGELEMIQDARIQPSKFALDSHGFEFVSFKTTFSDWKNRQAVQTQFYSEVEQLLKDAVKGADIVHIFEYRVGADSRKPRYYEKDANLDF